MAEAFASMEELTKVHRRRLASALISECRKTTVDVARVIEEWALRYEVAAVGKYSPERGGWEDTWLQTRCLAKAEALREDMPRMIEQILEGRDRPPHGPLAQLRDLLYPDEGD